MNRASSDRLAQAEALWALQGPARYPAADFREAWNSVELRLGSWVRGQLVLMGAMGLMGGLLTGLKYGYSPSLRVWDALKQEPHHADGTEAGENSDSAQEPDSPDGGEGAGGSE